MSPLSTTKRKWNFLYILIRYVCTHTQVLYFTLLFFFSRWEAFKIFCWCTRIVINGDTVSVSSTTERRPSVSAELLTRTRVFCPFSGWVTVCWKKESVIGDPWHWVITQKAGQNKISDLEPIILSYFRERTLNTKIFLSKNPVPLNYFRAEKNQSPNKNEIESTDP